MQMQMTDTGTPITGTSSYRLPLANLRWGAIFAGLVVGLSTHALLLMIGAAAGLAAAAGDAAPEGTMPIAAGVWNTVSMIIAAFVGAYIAARTSGMRRTSDGLLHGAVSWGATMIVSLLLATTLTGGMLGNLFTTGAQGQTGAVSGDVLSSVNQGDRGEAIALLQERAGLTTEQAARVVDQALILRGRGDQASPGAQSAAEDAMRTASVASGWLSAAIVLSLLAAIGGGIVGARGTRRPVDEGRRSVVYHQDQPPPATRKTAHVE